MARWAGHCGQSQQCHWHQAFTLEWVSTGCMESDPPSPGDSQGGGGHLLLPPYRQGCRSIPWHHTLPWGPRGKRIFLGQLRYGLSRFHFPNYET